MNLVGLWAVGRVVGSTTADDETLRALWNEHAGPLLAYAMRLTGGDRGRAEDVVQETLLRTWRRPPEADPERPSLRPWLLTVAHRIAIDHHRARQARPTEVGEAALAGVAVDDDVDRALESWLVLEALRSLSQTHREVLLETYYRDRSVAEAAATLGIPEGTVKSRTFYALRSLRVALEERGVTS
ncbi:MAG: polymerase sigma-70 factor, subfamily [Actinomycetota bacterium]|jgi:RNA polymerase sigma-70 factor (ECF subfamily)|nr:polymerase sigma-70 factor, subfamily [Actinomycetota bacterium]